MVGLKARLHSRWETYPPLKLAKVGPSSSTASPEPKVLFPAPKKLDDCVDKIYGCDNVPRDDEDGDEVGENLSLQQVWGHGYSEARMSHHSLARGANGPGAQVGKIWVYKHLEIGRGSSGTQVFEGYVNDGREIAVKWLPVQYYKHALREINFLINSDGHKNVVRYHGTEEDGNGIYLALEKCWCSLYELIRAQSPQSAPMTQREKDLLKSKGVPLRSEEDLKLWDGNQKPLWRLVRILKGIVKGLKHLQKECGIVHRDLKPQNVLISSQKLMQAKIADMGISKQLDPGAVSFQHSREGYSGGWEAPEQMEAGECTPKIDIFSLGCVFHHCITGGRHPFEVVLGRDGNIKYGEIVLADMENLPEAHDLVNSLLDPNPDNRPDARDVLRHPFFWTSERRLSFVTEVSDYLENSLKKCRPFPSFVGLQKELLADPPLNCYWCKGLDKALVRYVNTQTFRTYVYWNLLDMLRLIRNLQSHYRNLPQNVKALLGSDPEGLDEYFRSRFPQLVIKVYHLMGDDCKAGNCTDEKVLSFYPSKVSR
ncbi:unnamed protein product [Calypogeia fissa]